MQEGPRIPNLGFLVQPSAFYEYGFLADRLFDVLIFQPNGLLASWFFGNDVLINCLGESICFHGKNRVFAKVKLRSIHKWGRN